jgi:hypothetical protein
MQQLTLGDLAGNSDEALRQHIVNDYQASLDEVNKYEILIAFEECGPWGCDSSSFFLLREKGTKNLFEVHGSHCSCYGFEGQFKPEPTSKEYILSDKFSPGYSCNKETVSEFVQEKFGKKKKKKDGVLTKTEKEQIRDTIDNEGFDYGFCNYSSFDEYKDKEFHRLRLAYIDAKNALSEYIGEQE